MPAHRRGRSDIPLLDSTIAEHFEATVQRFPDRDALVMPHQQIRWTWRQFDAQIDRVALGLLAPWLAPRTAILYSGSALAVLVGLGVRYAA